MNSFGSSESMLTLLTYLIILLQDNSKYSWITGIVIYKNSLIWLPLSLSGHNAQIRVEIRERRALITLHKDKVMNV